MASKLGLYQKACMHLKQKAVTSLTHDIEIRYNLDLVYDDVVAWCLEEGYWNFAMRTVAIEHSEDVAPLFGYQWAFEKPEDWVRTEGMSATGNMWPQLGPDRFADETTNWHASCDPLYVSYVSNHTSFGMNLGNWPKTFTLFGELELALRIAGTITGMSSDELDVLEKRRARAMRDARSKDALNQASKMPPPGRLLMSRGGYRTRGYFGTTQD